MRAMPLLMPRLRALENSSEDVSLHLDIVMELSKESGMTDLEVYRIIMFIETSGLAMSFKVNVDDEKKYIGWGTPICKV